MKANFIFEWLGLWFVLQLFIFILLNNRDTNIDSCEEMNWIIGNIISFPLSIFIFKIINYGSL
jgi:hypothetical protein